MERRLTIASTGNGYVAWEVERLPPAHATPVVFPAYELPAEWSAVDWSPDQLPPRFRELFSTLRQFSRLTEDHARAINITLLPHCTPAELLPHTQPTSADPDKTYQKRLAELEIDNNTVFRIITGALGPRHDGEKPPRIAYLRNFFIGLESMSQYWDTSLDHYYQVNSNNEEDGQRDATEHCQARTADSDDEPNKRMKLGSDPSPPAPDSTSASAPQPVTQPQAQHSGDGTDAASTQTMHSSSSPLPPTLRYRGRRIDTGAKMPPQHRLDTINGLLQAVSFPFGCRTSSAARARLCLSVAGLAIPVRPSIVVYQNPRDRKLAREGVLVGPVMGAFVRSQTGFGDGDEGERRAKARQDLVLGEAGACLVMAQERNRQGKVERKPGEGLWWTERPRFGAGGGEVDVAKVEGRERERKKSVDLIARFRGKEGSRKDREKTDEERLEEARARAYEKWEKMAPPQGVWDPKTVYKAVGKQADSDWDQVCWPHFPFPHCIFFFFFFFADMGCERRRRKDGG